jgi:hypothetical protein
MDVGLKTDDSHEKAYQGGEIVQEHSSHGSY